MNEIDMKGEQIPRIQVEPHRIATHGTDAALLMSAYSTELDPWQRTVLDCWLGVDENDNYTVTSAGLSVPRQNGKNVILEGREFFGLVIGGERILHTAHQVRTSKKSFRRLAAIFTDERHPEVIELVKNIRYTNGEECIELNNGGSIEYSSRSRQAARGFEGISLVVFDEAQELTDDQIEAILAILSASATGTRQIIYTGTPPYPGCPGKVFRKRRAACMDDPSPHDAWHEWGVEAASVDEIDASDKLLWYMCNPALGIRLTEDFTAEEQRTMTADGFARERLGWWSPVLVKQTEYAIDAKAWEKCRSSAPKPEGKTAFGVKFSFDGSEVALCGAVCPADGPARISIIERKPTGSGIRWLADFLNARYGKASCVVIDGRNGADVLIEKLADVWKAPKSIVKPSAGQVVSAASQLVNEINEGTLTWFDKQEALSDSATTATRRPIGGGWGFGGEDSAPIEAAALALWGCRTSKRDPNKKMKVGC